MVQTWAPGSDMISDVMQTRDQVAPLSDESAAPSQESVEAVRREARRFLAEPGQAARQAARELLDEDTLDRLLDRVDAGELRLTGPGGFLPEIVKSVLERGLAAELTEHVGYEKGDPAGRGSPNSRNGATPKTVATEVGPVDLQVPRDRAGTFEPRLVPKGARRVGGLSDMIVSLYAGGMTVRDIGHHLQRTYGTELSHDTISKITDGVLEEVSGWQTRPLDEVYPIIYVDALVVKVRDGAHVVNKSAYLVVGVDLDGIKHVLGIWVHTGEGAKFWLGVLTELRNRGVPGRAHRLLRRPGGPAGGGGNRLAAHRGADLRGAPDPRQHAVRVLSGPQEGRRRAAGDLHRPHRRGRRVRPARLRRLRARPAATPARWRPGNAPGNDSSPSWPSPRRSGRSSTPRTRSSR